MKSQKDKKQLLVFVNSSFSWGGLEMNTLRLALWMRSYTEVHLLCQENSPLAQNALSEGIALDYISKKSKYLPIGAAYQLTRKLRKLKSKQVFFCDNKDMSYCCWAKLLYPSLKLYYQQHMQIGISKKDILHTLRYSFLDAWISPLVCLAEEVEQKTNINPNKIHCIPLGLDTESLLNQTMKKEKARVFWQIDNDYPWIGIMGRLDRLKNQHLLIEAVNILKQRNIFVNLLIVGEPTKEEAQQKYAEELHKMVEDADLEKQVHFYPFVKQIATFYCALDIFVMATDRETYGMVTLEAMLFELPVLSSNSGGSSEILKQGRYGTLFIPSNTEDIAGKIILMCEENQRIKQMAADAKRYVLDNFDYRVECQQIMKLIKDL